MENDELIDRFRFHPAITQESQEAHNRVRQLCMELALDLNELIVDGREKSLVMTKLEEVMMWANASIARNGGPAEPTERGMTRHGSLPVSR